MLKVEVKVDTSEVMRWLDGLKDEAKKAVVRALNKTAITARARSAREAQGVGYNLRLAAIKKAISIRRATANELRAILTANGRPIPLINYDARQTNQGVSVAVLHGRKTIKHAFIATMRSGHKGVFIRTGAAKEQERTLKHEHITAGPATTRHHGLPVKELFGPKIPDAFVNDAVQQALIEIVQQRFGVVLSQELRYVGLR